MWPFSKKPASKLSQSSDVASPAYDPNRSYNELTVSGPVDEVSRFIEENSRENAPLDLGRKVPPTVRADSKWMFENWGTSNLAFGDLDGQLTSWAVLKQDQTSQRLLFSSDKIPPRNWFSKVVTRYPLLEFRLAGADPFGLYYEVQTAIDGKEVFHEQEVQDRFDELSGDLVSEELLVNDDPAFYIPATLEKLRQAGYDELIRLIGEPLVKRRLADYVEEMDA